MTKEVNKRRTVLGCIWEKGEPTPTVPSAQYPTCLRKPHKSLERSKRALAVTRSENS